MIYKRYNGKKVKSGDPNYSKATWYVMKRIDGVLIHKALDLRGSIKNPRILANLVIQQHLEKARGLKSDEAGELVSRVYSVRKKAKPAKFVYIVESRGFYKIGMTIDTDKRLKSLKLSSAPSECHLIYSVNATDARKVEKQMHIHLSEYRVVGEWFNFTEEQLPMVKKILDFYAATYYLKTKSRAPYDLV